MHTMIDTRSTGRDRKFKAWFRTGARAVVLAGLLVFAWGNTHGQENAGPVNDGGGILLGQPLLPGVVVDDDKLARILPVRIARDPIRRRDVAANPDAWEASFVERFLDPRPMFNAVAFVRHADWRKLDGSSTRDVLRRGEVLAVLEDMFRWFGRPSLFLAGAEDADDYLGFVWRNEEAWLLVGFFKGEDRPWQGHLVASTAEADGGSQEVELQWELKGGRPVEAPESIRAWVTAWLEQLPE